MCQDVQRPILSLLNFVVYTVGFYSIKIAKKVFVTFDNIHAYLMSGLKKYEKKNNHCGLFLKCTLSVDLLCVTLDFPLERPKTNICRFSAPSIEHIAGAR